MHDIELLERVAAAAHFDQRANDDRILGLRERHVGCFSKAPTHWAAKSATSTKKR